VRVELLPSEHEAPVDVGVHEKGSHWHVELVAIGQP
jgi:hypothetical protein